VTHRAGRPGGRGEGPPIRLKNQRGLREDPELGAHRNRLIPDPGDLGVGSQLCIFTASDPSGRNAPTGGARQLQTIRKTTRHWRALPARPARKSQLVEKLRLESKPCSLAGLGSDGDKVAGQRARATANPRPPSTDNRGRGKPPIAVRFSLLRRPSGRGHLFRGRTDASATAIHASLPLPRPTAHHSWMHALAGTSCDPHPLRRSSRKLQQSLSVLLSDALTIG